MGKVIADMAMSLDGFVADPNDGCDELFGWYFAGGDVEVPTADGRWAFRTSAASAEHLREGFATVGALVCGRRVYDMTQGWGGTHPLGVPVFVLSHRPPDSAPEGKSRFTFVTDGIAAAIAQAQAAAGDKNVAVATPTVTRECLDARLLDGIQVNLVPVLLGAGLRYFDDLADTPIRLSDPVVRQGRGVTHLYYDVLYRDGR